MSALAYAAPISLIIISLAFFYVADFHRSRKVGRFDLLFAYGHLLMLAAVYLVMAALNYVSSPVTGAILGFFQLVMWVYVIVVLFLILRLLVNIINVMREVVTKKKEVGQWLKLYF